MIDCAVVFFFKQKTAYEMRISDWSSDVCSSDLVPLQVEHLQRQLAAGDDDRALARYPAAIEILTPDRLDALRLLLRARGDLVQVGVEHLDVLDRKSVV